jgi:outer membrane receptor for monomeric catechols
MRLPTRILLLTAATGLWSATARAQTTTPPAAPTGGEVHQLERFVVTDVPVEFSVNPLTRETDGVFGDSRNPLETPRAVSTITAGLVNERAIDGLREILEYSPGAYAPSSYGELTVSYLRGDVAEAYVNGQRRSDNFYGYLPSFNGVEAVDVVRGPGSVVFGAGYLTGGYVNYVTKQPKFSAPETTVTTRLGTWAPGGLSYGNASVQLDTTAPVNDHLAWRLSYEAKGGDTFYHRAGVKDDRQDLFGALTWKSRPGVTLAFNGQWLWQDSPETLGVNRVTQDLIWHDAYLTGQSADGGWNPGPVPATGAVQLPRDATLFSRGDYAQAHVGSAQLIATIEATPDLTFVNRTLVERVNRKRVYQMGYIEFVTQNTFENRTEAHLQLPNAPLPQSIIAGVAVRLEAVRSFENYSNEYLYDFDITNPTQVFNQAKAFPNSYLPGAPGADGLPFFSPVDPIYPTPETGDSRVWNPAVFVQDDVKLADKLNLLVGARGDSFRAHATDPLPPASTKPVSDSDRTNAVSGNASLLYRATRTSSYYITWQRVAALHGNLGGGGVSLRSGGAIDPFDLRDHSELFETGAKYSLLENQLYAGVAAYTQRRTRVSQGGEHNDIRVRGLEFETVYQPNQRLSATFNATWQDGRYLDAAPFQLGGRSIYDGIALGRGPGGLGRGTASYSPWDDQVPVGNWPLVGFSRVMANGSVRYRWENGFGVGVDGQGQSPQAGNLDNEWHIPSQYTLNASFSYTAKTWSANLDLRNLTDQRNWIHNGDAYTASELIMPDLPRRVEGYVKFKF